MYAAERLKKIRMMVSEYKKVNVAQLSKYFSVSEVTIRKDLAQLEREGLLIRTHGGAVINDSASGVDKYFEPADEAENLLKHSLAKQAAALVNNGELIFLGAGTTCTEIARELLSRNSLTVVTNNMTAAIVLSANININVFVVGGNLFRRGGNYTLIDKSMADFFSDKYMDKLFITTDGISFRSGFTIHNEVLAESYSRISAKADKTIICALSDKFNKNAFSNFASLAEPDILITDRGIPQDYLDFFKKNDVTVYIAD